MKTITIPVTNRPHYFRQAVSSLKKCIGIWSYTIVIGQLMADETILKIINLIDFCDVKVIKNRSKLGPLNNPLNIMRHSFNLLNSLINLHLDDDVLVSPDSLNLLLAFINIKDDNHKTFSLLNFNSNADSIEDTIVFSKRFYGLGQVIFKDVFFEIFLPNWFNYQYCRKYYNTAGLSWDWAVAGMMVLKGWLHTVPLLSRCNHIGRSGTNCNLQFQIAVFDNLRWNTDKEIKDFKINDKIIYDWKLSWDK